MQNLRWLALLGLAILFAVIPGAQAQERRPRIGYVYPAGGPRTNSFEVVVGGQYLTGVTNVFISGTGVRAVIADYSRPISQGEFRRLEAERDELLKKRGANRGKTSDKSKSAWTDADEKRLAEIRKLMSKFVRRPANPSICEQVTLRVTADPNADPGEREIRLGTALGLTNPLIFNLGLLPEYSEAPSRDIPQQVSTVSRIVGKIRKGPDSVLRVSVPSVVNGQILPGDVDRFSFSGKKGQSIVIAVNARQLIPYLPDAVPGWFQAVLAIYDSQGRELAYDDDFRFNPDPVLHYEIPADGEYTMEIKDSIYRGREDFVYRITIAEMPFLTSIFPLGGPSTAASKIELKGWNLPVNNLTLDPRGKGAGSYPIAVRNANRISNQMFFSVDTLPEAPEKEPNNERKKAQSVVLPVIINGHIDKPHDSDVFCFNGRAGQRIVAEVNARRLNSPLDSILKLTTADGKVIATNDDNEDKGAWLTTHHADSYLNVTLPADGVYCLAIGDTQYQGSPDHAYRLRISPPRPDFELRCVPSSISARAGSTASLTVFALRKDGYSNDIAIALKDAPKGFQLSDVRIPAGKDQVKINITMPSEGLSQPTAINLIGCATIDGKEVVHHVIPSEDMMQAFAYRHLVPSKELLVSATPSSYSKYKKTSYKKDKKSSSKN